LFAWSGQLAATVRDFERGETKAVFTILVLLANTCAAVAGAQINDGLTAKGRGDSCDKAPRSWRL